MYLQLENVSYTYSNKRGSVCAVANAEQGFGPGMYAIVGPSGGGKSTLLSLMAGLRLPTAGRVLYDGVSTGEMDRGRLRREKVSLIYQDLNLFSRLTAEENVMYPLRIRAVPAGQARTTAREKLLAVGLKEEQFGRFPQQLSGGERQRVAIARALAAGSQFIFADEPTGSLDGENSRNIVSMLRRLAHEEGRCVVVVTHDLQAAAEADVVLKMQGGTLEAGEA